MVFAMFMSYPFCLPAETVQDHSRKSGRRRHLAHGNRIERYGFVEADRFT
jgi:hypothetical protein